MFDSLLYGNGLTLAVVSGIWELAKSNPSCKYLSVDEFMKDFALMPNHKRICRDFMKTFNKDTKTYSDVHTENKRIMALHIDDINKLGFERWVSTIIFSLEIISEEDLKNIKPYIYSLYNYWYSFISTTVLSKDDIQFKLEQYAIEILSKVNGNIMTLNFDNMLDKWLNPSHLHGSFALPYESFKDIHLFNYNDNKNFEYRYLFGGNGLEKLDRLNRIRKMGIAGYDMDFFYQEIKTCNLGHLLTYGVSFGRSYILSDAFLDEYPQHNDAYLNKCVDGHILLKLDLLFKNHCVDKITIAYYSESDLNAYKEILSHTKFKQIVTFERTQNIFVI